MLDLLWLRRDRNEKNRNRTIKTDNNKLDWRKCPNPALSSQANTCGSNDVSMLLHCLRRRPTFKQHWVEVWCPKTPHSGVYELSLTPHNKHATLYCTDIPRSHQTRELAQCCFNVGPTSKTLGQHWNSIVSMSDGRLDYMRIALLFSFHNNTSVFYNRYYRGTWLHCVSLRCLVNWSSWI